MRKLSLAALVLFTLAAIAIAPQGRAQNHFQNHSENRSWRPATESELKSLIPARAPVQQERIETEMRTASGITDGRGKFIAGVVLITAGYSADGKYSHFFLTQVPLRIGHFQLAPGDYIIGWVHLENGNGLNVRFYEAASGKLLGSIDATLNPAVTRVESFRVWPPADHSIMQIGRFTFAYQIVGG